MRRNRPYMKRRTHRSNKPRRIGHFKKTLIETEKRTNSPVCLMPLSVRTLLLM